MILHPHIAQMRMEAARKRQSSSSGSRLTVAKPPNRVRDSTGLSIPKNMRVPRISLQV